MPKRPARRRSDDDEKQVVGLIGVGLDAKDGHKRITRGQNFLLFGGSKKTHSRMVDVAVVFNEKVDKTGKELGDLSHDEVIELFEETRSEVD